MNTVASLPDRLRYMVADGRNMGVNERTIDLDAIEQAATLLSEQGEVAITTDASGRCVAVTRQDGEGRILSVIWEASEHGGGGEAVEVGKLRVSPYGEFLGVDWNRPVTLKNGQPIYTTPPTPSAPDRTDKEQHVNAVRVLWEMGWRWKGGGWIAPSAPVGVEAAARRVASFLDHANLDTSRLPTGMGSALRALRDALTPPAAAPRVDGKEVLQRHLVTKFRDGSTRVEDITAIPATSEGSVRPSATYSPELQAAMVAAASEDGLPELAKGLDEAARRMRGEPFGNYTEWAARAAECERAANLIRRLAASGQGVEGWKLVPVEPTKAMLDAAWAYGVGDNPPDPGYAYRAMLAAAPTQEGK